MIDNKFLELYPFRAADYEINNSVVTVLFKKEKSTFIEKVFLKKLINKPYKIDLDEIGSFIWTLCDGKNDVKKIMCLTKEKFSNKVEPVEERVNLFINQLNKTKLINLFEKKRVEIM